MGAQWSGSHTRPCHHPVCPGYFHRLLMEARCQAAPMQPTPALLPESLLHHHPPHRPLLSRRGDGPGGWWHCKGLPSLHPRDPKFPLPSPCPGLCQPLPTALPGACGFSVRISLSFLLRTEQLIIYPIIKEETVNEMKTSQKHLLGLLSSPPRAACAGSGGGRGPGAPGGPAAAGGCPPHPAFLAVSPSSSGTPRPPWPHVLSLLHHQSLAETCPARVTNGAGGCPSTFTGLALPGIPRDVPGCWRGTGLSPLSPPSPAPMPRCYSLLVIRSPASQAAPGTRCYWGGNATPNPPRVLAGEHGDQAWHPASKRGLQDRPPPPNLVLC